MLRLPSNSILNSPGSPAPVVPSDPFFFACFEPFHHFGHTASSTESHNTPKSRRVRNLSKQSTGPEVLPSETPRIPLENAYFVRAANLLYILASHQTFPQNAFVFNVLRLPLQRFDYLTEGTVAQELEDLGQERLVWSFISSASVFHNFVHKPREKFLRAVIDRPVHYTNFQPVLEIPF